jgi:PAS domain S-box-containing protein
LPSRKEGNVSEDKTISEQDHQLPDAWQAGTYEWWPSADRVVWSPELIRIYGLKQAPAAEEGFAALVHPDDRVRVEGETSTYLGSHVTSYSHSFRIVRPDGAVRVILDRGAIERDAAGNVRVIRGINIDVTDDARIGSSMRHAVVAGDSEASALAHVPPPATPAIVFEWDIRADKVQRIVSDHPALPETAGQPDTFEHVAKAVHPDDRDGFRAAVAAALGSADGKYRSRHRVDGPERAVQWFVESGCVEFDADRTPLRLIGFTHVITEQERLEGELAESNAVLTALFDGVPVGLGIWDSELRFLRVNPELAAINGLPPAAHIGRRPDEILPDLADYESLYRRWRAILETGEPWRGVEISGETPAEPGRLRHWEEHFFPVRIGGRNVGIAAVVQETTQRKAAEEELRASEERYRTLFEAIDQGFCVLEVRLDAPDGRIDYRVVEANPAFYDRTGFPETILGQWLRKAAPDLEDHWYETYGSVARTGVPMRFEQHSDMLGRWFNVYAFRIGAPEDYRVAVLFSDISERKNREEQTRLLMREADHRSKNMLSLVQAIARQTASSGANEFIDRFGERVHALAAAQDLLFRNSWTTVPVADLVRSQLAHFSDLIGERIEIDGPPLGLTPDTTQALGMALHELATNATKYGALSNETGRIKISWSVERDPSPEPKFTLSWLESGGPPVARPKRAGFGSTVTTRMVEASTHGEVLVDFAATGLVWRLSCPVADVVDG